MSAKTTTAQLVARPLQYTAETTEGEKVATATATVMGAVEMVSIKKDGKYIEVGQLGPEDIISLIAGLRTFETQIQFKPTSETFIKRGCNAANYGTPAGTISETITIYLVIYLNGTLNYIQLLGSREKNFVYTREAGKDDICTIDYEHTSITVPSSSAPSGITLQTTFPTGTVWNHLTGGVNPVSWNGVGLNCKKFTITVNRNTTPDHTIGNRDPYSTQPHGRRIAGDFLVLWTSTSLESDENTDTVRTLALVLNSTGPVTLTVTASKIVTYGRDLDVASDQAVAEAIGFKGVSVAIA